MRPAKGAVLAGMSDGHRQCWAGFYNMLRRSSSRCDEAERRFPWRVDILVPELGLRGRLTAMLDWAERRFGGIEGWDQHGVTVGRRPDGTPIDAARFYFGKEADALAFRKVWGGEVWKHDTGAARPDEGAGR
jgi:hypothetical protein